MGGAGYIELYTTAQSRAVGMRNPTPRRVAYERVCLPAQVATLVKANGIQHPGRLWECGGEGRVTWLTTDQQPVLAAHDKMELNGGRALNRLAEKGGAREFAHGYQRKEGWQARKGLVEMEVSMTEVLR